MGVIPPITSCGLGEQEGESGYSLPPVCEELETVCETRGAPGPLSEKALVALNMAGRSAIPLRR